MDGSAATAPAAETGVFEWAWRGTPVRVGYDVRGADAGHGTVVLLPAFSTVSSRDEMRPLAERLAPDFRTVAPDWPGFGAGRHPRLDHGPDLHAAFLRAFVERVVGGPAAVVAAGHAAGYALLLARERPGTWTRLALLAPTWRGPLPTMMGGYRPVQDRVRAALHLPAVGHALYRLNVAGPVIAAMYRRHVYADAGRVTPGLVAAKAEVARRRGGRFGSGAFVTGALDPVRDRGAFLALVDPPSSPQAIHREAIRPVRAGSAKADPEGSDVAEGRQAPTLVVYGAGTPPKSLAEMEALARLPGVASRRLPVGSLGVHEERAHAVAEAIRPFLLREPPR